MNLKELNKNHILTICIIILVIAVCSILIACENSRKIDNISINLYNNSFYELIDNMNDVENYLVKALITTDSIHEAETFMYIWKDAGQAQTNLSQIPISNDGLSNTQKFLNQVSEYSYTLAMKNINGYKLEQKEFENIKKLYNYSVEINLTLNQIMQEIGNGTISWSELQKDGSSLFQKNLENDSIDVFDNIESNFEEYDGLIYDGAYSEHITNTEKKGLTGENINEEKAKELAEKFIKIDNIKEIKSNGISENATIRVYTFEINTNDGNNITLAITEEGGHILFMNYNRDVMDEKITQDEAKQRALEFLNSNGFTNMETTYYIKESGIMTINYAYKQEDVIIYPDLIKVKVALDNGDILGIETTGYINNHEIRNIDKSNIISNEQAQKSVNDNLKIESTRLAIIPTEFKTEIFCWEIQGKVEERNFLLYVNAMTGKVEDILVIIDTGNGILTQ